MGKEKQFTVEQLKEMQAWDLDRKIATSLTRIAEFVSHYPNGVYVSFSGGKDSTVLLDLVRKIIPDVPVVFSNTGLEYPEIQTFARSKGAEIVRPKMRFNEVITKYGYPIISKEVASAIYYARRIIKELPENYPDRRLKLMGKYAYKLSSKHSQKVEPIRKTSELLKQNTMQQKQKELLGQRTDVGEAGNIVKSPYNKKKWLPIARDMPFLVSHYCCNVMKKSPLDTYGRQTKRKAFIGTMADESIVRKQVWLRHGCNAFDSKKITSQPLSFWTEQDILEYIARFKLDICSVYGDIIKEENGKLHCSGCQRTGCVFCGFGCHMEKRGQERFLMLKKTHPKQYAYCIGGGQWSDNPYYDPNASTEDEIGWVNWNPKKIWTPSKEGLGFGMVFDYLNAEYGKDFIRYK